MSFEESLIIETLLNEDEKIDLYNERSATEEISSWNFKKIELSLVRKVKRNPIPKIKLVKKSNIPKKILHPAFSFPAINTVSKGKPLIYENRSQNVVSSQFKTTQQLLESAGLSEINRFNQVNYKKSNTNSHEYLIGSSSTQVNGNLAKRKRATSIESNSNLLFNPNENKIKHKNPGLLPQNSGKYDRYFNKKEEVKIEDYNNLNKVNLSVANSRTDITDIQKNGQGTAILRFPTGASPNKQAKNFLLTPVYSNLIKYSLAYN